MIAILAISACTNVANKAGSGDSGDPCNPNDQDGIIGGNATFILTVNEQGFVPLVITAQNAAQVALTLVNAGTQTHDFVIDCIPTPNDIGCPTTTCFPNDANIEPVAAGLSATASFFAPRVEGIYYFHSTQPGDTDGPCTIDTRGCGQFVVK